MDEILLRLNEQLHISLHLSSGLFIYFAAFKFSDKTDFILENLVWSIHIIQFWKPFIDAQKNRLFKMLSLMAWYTPKSMAAEIDWAFNKNVWDTAALLRASIFA